MRRKSIESKEMERCSNIKEILFYLVFISFCLSNLTLIFSVEINSCSSGGVDGICEIGRVCTCSISDACTNGNLLLYREELTNPVCSPQIVGNSVPINPDYCEFTEGLLYARADCDEGQSSEKTIMFSQLETTTITKTTTTSLPTTTVTVTVEEITHKCFGGKGYCEDIMTKCQSGYEYCPEYNYDCPGFDEKCCCLEKEYGRVFPWLENVNFRLVVFLILAVVVGVILFLFFVSQTKRGMSFEKLRKKWSR